MILLFGMCLAASCESADDGKEGDVDKTACDKEDELIANAANDYCESKKDECCYCRCFMQGKLYDYQELMDNGNCVCLEDEADDTDTDTETSTDTADAGAQEACVGKELQDAENCLDDTDACTSMYLTKVESGCAMSQLE